jgi:hypothetical protein
MDALSRDELKALMEQPVGGCVSLYMPTHRAIPEAYQDPIRFRNLLNQAEERLMAGGMRAPEAKELLKPAQQLAGANDFWRHQSDGLALFLSPAGLRHYRLPVTCAELVVASDRFHLKPLLRLLSSDGRFFVLALSKNEVRLLEGTRDAVSEINLENVPSNLAQILQHYDFEKQLQFRSTASAARGRPAAAFHGHGAGTDEEKDKIRQYFRQVDEGLRELLKTERAPLVLAGVESLFPLYREVNSYPHLLAEGVTGNPDKLSARELHQQAWKLAQPQFLKGQQEAAARYSGLAGTGRASSDLKEVAVAAYGGRIESLLVATGVQRWGRFDPQQGALDLHEQAQPGDEEVLDFIALRTFLSGGDVYAVEPEQVPGGGPIAAVFRY